MILMFIMPAYRSRRIDMPQARRHLSRKGAGNPHLSLAVRDASEDRAMLDDDEEKKADHQFT